jgi:hypothetical protein
VHYEYWAELPEHDVMELFELLETEYQLAPGLLRPPDRLDKLFEPVTTKNPLKWLVYRARTEDSATELNYRLGKRQQRYKTRQAWQQAGIATVDDLVRAWCGRAPGDKAGEPDP